MTRLGLAALLLAASAGTAVAQSTAPPLQVSGAWARMQGDVTGMSAGYFTILNGGTAAVIVRGVSCRDIRMASFHESALNNGMMRMVPRDSLVVPAGGQVALRPGGIHVMLMGLGRGLSVGDHLRCTLRTSAGDVAVDAVVRAR